MLPLTGGGLSRRGGDPQGLRSGPGNFYEIVL